MKASRPARPTKADATLTDLAIMHAAQSQQRTAQLWADHYGSGACKDPLMAAKFEAMADAARWKFHQASHRIAERAAGTYAYMTVSDRVEGIQAAFEVPSKANDYGRSTR